MNEAIATPTDLAALVGYQPGSVVSRVLMRNRGGGMTLFAFAEGEGLSEHTSPHEAIVQVVEGAARITVGEEEHRVEAGQMLHFPATVPHALHGDAAFKMLLTLLKEPRQAR